LGAECLRPMACFRRSGGPIASDGREYGWQCRSGDRHYEVAAAGLAFGAVYADCAGGLA
jgi:hypothetical protein